MSGEAAAKVFTWQAAIAALQNSYAQPFGPGACPSRVVAATDGAWVRNLPSNPPGCRYFGAKLMGAAMAAPDAGVEYVIVLFDRETSAIAGFLDANLITGFRTAATSAAALDRILSKRSLRLGVIGSGLEASMHTRAFAAVRELGEVTVFSPNPVKRERFAEQLSAELATKVTAAASPEAAVSDVDVVLTAARSYDEKPILFADWLPDSAAVVSIGSTVPSQRELDTSVIARADLIVCDMREEVLHETGDMIAAFAENIDATARTISLNAVMSGQAEEMLANARRPMFKSVGSGLQDVVVGGMILDHAIQEGLATTLPISFERKLI